MAAITLVVFLQVISRYVLAYPLDWPEGLARILFVWIALLFGLDLVPFGIMGIANLGIGYVTPPVGTRLSAACSISKEPLDRVIRPLVPLLLVMVALLAVVTFVPDLTLVVPRLLYRK